MTFNTLDRPDLLNHFLILRYSLLCSLYSAAGNAPIKIHTCILLFKFMLTSVVTFQKSHQLTTGSLFLANTTVQCKSGCSFAICLQQCFEDPSYYGFAILSPSFPAAKVGKGLGKWQGMIYEEDHLWLKTLDSTGYNPVMWPWPNCKGGWEMQSSCIP